SPEVSPATMAIRTVIARSACSAHETTPGFGDEIREQDDFRLRGGDLSHALASLFERQSAAVEGTVGALDAGDGLGRVPSAAQPFAVDAVRLGRVARHGHERRKVLQEHRSHAAEAVRTNAAELVHT